MPVFVPPAPKNWGPLFAYSGIVPTWGNLGLLDANKGEGMVRAVLPTPNGGAIWMQGGYGWQYWRLFPDGSLHRYTWQANGSLREFRVETVQGAIVYTSPTPFSGSTAGDAAWAARPKNSPFHVTDSSGTTWFYDDAGEVSFGVNKDGSVSVYDLNLTPDGPVPTDGTFVGIDSRGRTGNPMPAYLGFPYRGRVLPDQPFSDSALGQRPGYLERAIPYTISADYFRNLTLPDEKIKTMSAAGLASIYYSILDAQMQGNCPHYIPNPTLSAGMSEAQAYANEMDIRMRIYTLRPDMHFIVNDKGEKVVGLVDPMKIPMYNGMKCKESMLATIGLSVALGLVTMGAGAILPVLGTLANLAQFGSSVAEMFAAKEGMQKMLDFQAEVQQGVAGLLKQTTPPVPPQPVRSSTPTTGVVATASSGNYSLAFLLIPLLLLL